MTAVPSLQAVADVAAISDPFCSPVHGAAVLSRQRHGTQDPNTVQGKVDQMTRYLRLSTICLTLALAAVLAPVAAAWSNNDFFNPSGNIQCTYTPDGAPAWLACQTRSNHHVAWLEVNTAAHAFVDRAGHFGLKAKHDGGWYGLGHVLPYGQHWQSHQFSCLSTFGGMRCWTSSTSHGFFINAWEVKTF